tara:strand:- start:1087 stop:1914 length:828 start_codon:yes stop_codon:yes gene_type:complete
MINIFLDFDKNIPDKINLVDYLENIPGHFESEDKKFYENFEIKFWTLDYNAERLADTRIFKSDPWILFHEYNLSKNFICDFVSTPNKKFICLTFHNKPHRSKILNFIKEKNLNCYVSENAKGLTEIPEHYPNGYYKNRYDYGVPKEYFNSFIEIVTESYVNFSSHFSEKSYKPLFYKKPFIAFAGPYYYTTMKKYGFELYDELFDYDFDTNENVEERISDILFQLLTINSLSLSELTKIIDNMKSKIEHNYNNLFKLKSKFYESNNKLLYKDISI